MEKSGSFRRKCLPSAYRNTPPNGFGHGTQSTNGIPHDSFITTEHQNDRYGSFKIDENDHYNLFKIDDASQRTISLMERRAASLAEHPGSLKVSPKEKSPFHAHAHKPIKPLNSGGVSVHPVQNNSTTTLSTTSDNSQVNSNPSLSMLLETNIRITPVSPTSVILSPDEAILAEEYFPVTFGATSYTSCHVKGSFTTPEVWSVHDSSSSSKRAIAKPANHLHGRRPGSGQSSSSSNSKSSIERTYFMATDSPGNGLMASLASTPYQTQVARLRMEQLRMEEERLQHLRIKSKQETRSPLEKQYEMKTPQFPYQASKYSNSRNFAGNCQNTQSYY